MLGSSPPLVNSETELISLLAAGRHRAAFAVLLTTLAGFLDAVGYVQLNHLYVSFMSGNSTHLGVALANLKWIDAFHAGAIIAAFVAGASIGTVIADAASRLVPLVVLCAEFQVFVVAILLATVGADRMALTLVALAMGMQNTLHQTLSGADVGKSFITGTLFHLGQSLARVFRCEEQIGRVLLNALSWLAFIGGVIAGAVVLAAIGLVGSLGAIAVVLVLMIIFVGAGWI